MGVSVKVDISNAEKISNRIFSKNVMVYANTRLHSYCSPYVPMDTGMLDQTVDITKDYVHYKVPYAHKMYEGKGLNFSKDEHPLSTSKWDEAMKVAKGKQLADDITAYIKKR